MRFFKREKNVVFIIISGFWITHFFVLSVSSLRMSLTCFIEALPISSSSVKVLTYLQPYHHLCECQDTGGSWIFNEHFSQVLSVSLWMAVMGGGKKIRQCNLIGWCLIFFCFYSREQQTFAPAHPFVIHVFLVHKLSRRRRLLEMAVLEKKKEKDRKHGIEHSPSFCLSFNQKRKKQRKATSI